MESVLKKEQKKEMDVFLQMLNEMTQVEQEAFYNFMLGVEWAKNFNSSEAAG